MESIIGISYHLVYSDPTVKSFNDDQLCWRCYAICFLIAKLALHHIIDCWGTVARQAGDIDGRRARWCNLPTNYVVSARLQRRTQLSGKLSNVVQLCFEALNRLRARGFGRGFAAEIWRDQERRRSTSWRR